MVGPLYNGWEGPQLRSLDCQNYNSWPKSAAVPLFPVVARPPDEYNAHPRCIYFHPEFLDIDETSNAKRCVYVIFRIR